MSTNRPLSREGLILLFVIALGWGVNWPVMKIALAEIPPLTFRGVTVMLGGVGVLLIARLQGLSVAVARRHWFGLLTLLVFNIIGWNSFSTYALLHLPAGRASLLAFTMPVWCVPLSILLLGEKMSWRRSVALALGCAGVVVLMGHSIGEVSRTPLGVGLMLAAAVSWAIGVVLLKYFALAIPTLLLSGWSMCIGGLVILVAAVFVDGIPTHLPGAGGSFGIVYNIFITCMLCNWAWNRFVLLVPVSVSSLSSLLTPLVGVISGALILGERPGLQEGTAALLILSSVAVINSRYRRAQPRNRC